VSFELRKNKDELICELILLNMQIANTTYTSGLAKYEVGIQLMLVLYNESKITARRYA